MQHAYWTLSLTYDTRQLFAWAIDPESGCDVSDDLRASLAEAIETKAATVNLTLSERNEVELIAMQADIQKSSFRMTVSNLLRSLDELKKAQPSGHHETADAVVVPPVKQGSLFPE